MWFLLPRKLDKRILFALQIFLLIIAVHALLFFVLYASSKLLRRNTEKQTFAMRAIRPGARVVVMPMLARRTIQQRGNSTSHTAEASGTTHDAQPVVPSAPPTQPVAQQMQQVAAATPSPQGRIRTKNKKKVDKKAGAQKKGKKEVHGKKDKKKKLEHKVVTKKTEAAKKTEAVAPAVSKMVEQQPIAMPTTTTTSSGPVAESPISPLTGDTVISTGEAVFGEDVIVVSTAAELQAVQALQELVIGLQTTWHPPIGFKPKRPLLVEVVGDKHGKLSVVAIKQSSGILAYDMQAKNAIAQIEPIAGAADMRLVLEF